MKNTENASQNHKHQIDFKPTKQYIFSNNIFLCFNSMYFS